MNLIQNSTKMYANKDAGQIKGSFYSFTIVTVAEHLRLTQNLF
jgi:hypothetical protein